MFRSPIRALSLALILALAATPHVALADPADAKATAAADAKGRAHFQRGQKLSASGDYAAAYREFAAGYAATGRPLFLFNMAEAARASGDTAKARESYLEFLRVDPTSALAATARTRLGELAEREHGSTAGTTARPGPEHAGGTTARPEPERGAPPAEATAPVPPRPEPLPLLPPSATQPQPPADGTTASLPPERLAATREPERAPLWKKWPFWAAVGGVVAGGIVVFAVTRDGEVCGKGCTQIDFR
ncbi:MAG TPA: hypothetical protein VFK02_13780 [Kofleriaceae bacterium]|nr:hypothetical protein [Kofleriaceae bacterium]